MIKKTDLIPGYHGVQLRDGRTFILGFCADTEGVFLMGCDDAIPLSDYNNNLQFGRKANLDIISVFKLRMGKMDSAKHPRQIVWRENHQQRSQIEINSIKKQVLQHEAYIRELNERKEHLEKSIK